MKSRIIEVGLALAAWAAALVAQAAFAPSVAEAGRYYLKRPPVTGGDPQITAALVIALVLAIAIELALVIYLSLPRRRGRTPSQVQTPQSIDVGDNERRAA
jgi:hypothetical protein